MKLIPYFLIPSFFLFSHQNPFKVNELSNDIFKADLYWRGADGAATVQLSNGRVLWLFSDTFIDQDGTGKRSNAKVMIRNSIALQAYNSIESGLTFYNSGTKKQPDSFFKIPGDSWFWTGHGIELEGKLLIFLIEEIETKTDLGFQACGWYLALIENPLEDPEYWTINYLKGPETFGIIVGSSAVLEQEGHIYTFGVKEPATHETYLLRFSKADLLEGNLDQMEWWVNNAWEYDLQHEPSNSSLFFSQTEFSVHYDNTLNKFIQIQSFGFGSASIGYRLADKLQGPWSEPVMFFTPTLKENEFAYTANAHPELNSDGIIITYNINTFDFNKLISNEDLYFPKILNLKFD